MILFIIIAVCILLYTIFADKWLIYCIKRDSKSFHPVREVLKDINLWFWINVGLNVINAGVVFLVSCCVLIGSTFVCPVERSQWQFNINALEDNLVTEGHYYGRRGYVDGELSYFYSRSFANGEKIGHMPADKTYIKYDNNAHPHVEVHNKRLDIPDWMHNVFWIEGMNDWSTEYYVLIVPEGTITNMSEYSIDMK